MKPIISLEEEKAWEQLKAKIQDIQTDNQNNFEYLKGKLEAALNRRKITISPNKRNTTPKQKK
jgi:hypothetical protein